MANIHTTLTSLFSDIANSIRVKTGNSNSIIADNFPNEISSIVTLAEGSADATATTVDIANNKIAYANGQKVVGTGEMASDLADEIAAQDELILQLITALENKASVGVIVGEITQSTSNPSITMPDVVNKDNVVLMYMSSSRYQASAMADAGLGSVIVHGTSHSYTIMYASELSSYSDDGFIEYDKTIGKISIASNMRYNETFIAGKYIYVAW